MTIKYSTVCVCITLNLSSYVVFTFFLGFPGGSDGEESACSTGDLGLIPGLGRLPREGNATHSSVLAWRIPWTEEPGGNTVHGVATSRT